MFYAAHGSVRSWLFNESTMTRDRYNGICRRWEWLLLPGLLLGLLQLQAAVGYAQRPEKSRLSKLQQEQKQLASRFSESLLKLAAFCDEKQFVEPAARIRALAKPLDTRRLVAHQLPVTVREEIATGLPPDQRHWQVQLRHLQSQYARDIYILSRTVLRNGFPSYALDLVREVAFHDPDHKQARDLLGYVRYRNSWVTPFEKSRLSASPKQVWHAQYGWIPEVYLKRYEQGERRYRNRWLSAEQEAEIRSDFRNAWQVRTGHFLVKTNYSLEQGVKVASTLEDFRRFFFQTFVAYFNTPHQIQQIFAGGKFRNRRLVKPHQVHYYRTREEYNQRLVAVIPQIAITNGLYYTPDRTSYFFFNSESSSQFDTLYHEATHQFLYENLSTERPIAEHANFWIVEGIACYMESFRPDVQGFSVGDPQHIRFRAARHRLLNDKYYVPLEEFSARGLKAFQSDLTNISKNYSQASGLAHFFMHFENGRYRDALIAHLRAIYRPRRSSRVEVPGLDELTGTSFDDLDRQYIGYMKRMQDEYD